MTAEKISLFRAAHLSQDDLIRYQRGELRAKERHEAETHLLDCELCSEALQGLEGMDDSMRLARITHELHARSIHKSTTRRRIFSSTQILSIVAAIFILAIVILISLYIFWSR
jgi:anti-sigma factor RsiW